MDGPFEALVILTCQRKIAIYTDIMRCTLKAECPRDSPFFVQYRLIYINYTSLSQQS